MSHAVEGALERAHAEELRRAARALLRTPLMHAAGSSAEDFRLVRRHAQELRSWFDANTGWRLIVDSEVARLAKVAPTSGDASHPARDPRSRTPFGRRRYVLTCLALSVLERSDAQITLGRLAEGVMVACADERLAGAGLSFRLREREERADLVAVVRLLLELGVLARVAGEEDAFVRDTGDALYDVRRRVLAGVLAAPRGPSTIDARGFERRLARLGAETLPETDDLRNRALRHNLTRRLLDDPIVYHQDLDAAQLAYLTSQRSALTRRVSELIGLLPEARAEGVAMVDPDDDLTDVRMPDVGTDGHLTLLLAEHLAERARSEEGWGEDSGTPRPPLGGPRRRAGGPKGGPRVSEDELRLLVRRLATEHRAYWRRDTREPGAEGALLEGALQRLDALRLVRRETDGVVALPALCRYALAPPTVVGEPQQIEIPV